MMQDNGYGDSLVATQYIYARIKYIMENCFEEEMEDNFFNLMDELAINYKKDTGKEITEEL
jgi:hypothetical protein